MLQATTLYGDLFEPFFFFQNFLSSSKMDIRLHAVILALMHTFVDIVFAEG